MRDPVLRKPEGRPGTGRLQDGLRRVGNGSRWNGEDGRVLRRLHLPGEARGRVRTVRKGRRRHPGGGRRVRADAGRGRRDRGRAGEGGGAGRRLAHRRPLNGEPERVLLYSAAAAPPSSSGRGHFFYFFPDPHGQGSFRPTRGPARTMGAVWFCTVPPCPPEAVGDSPCVSTICCWRRWGTGGSVVVARP